MGNPSIQPQAFGAVSRTDRKPTSHNGILIYLRAGTYPEPDLPKAGPDQQDNPIRKVIARNVPEWGTVCITYELYSYNHGRNKFWAWRAVWADQVEEGAQPE